MSSASRALPGGRIRTASITTLGCKLNQAESYRIQVELARAGVDLVPFGEAADLSIVNTCTVTHVADQQGRQLLRRASRFSQAGVVVAMGCYAQVAPDAVARVEGVDLVVTSDKEDLVGRLRGAGYVLGAEPGADLDGPGGPDAPGLAPATRVRQFVKVQDGCDDYCTYCIVPFARGHAVSRSSAEIVREVADFVAHGVKEVVLTGVQIGAYGRDRYADRGHELAPPGAPLAALVRRLLEETSIARVRVSSIQPQDWSEEFIALFADSRLCRHLHLPLQAGCDATLRRMARRYTTTDFAQVVDRLRSAVPDIAITADVIVGFPGESDADHATSVGFVREMAFTEAHVFRYSPRAGTAAARASDPVPPEVRKTRAEEMRACAAAAAQSCREQNRGKQLEVLWEEALPAADYAGWGVLPGDGQVWSGLTDTYLRVATRDPGNLLGTVTSVRLGELRGPGFWAE